MDSKMALKSKMAVSAAGDFNIEQTAAAAAAAPAHPSV
jgi:hypothetical protein